MNRFSPGQSVWFPSWPEALKHLRLPGLRRSAYRQALIAYLRFCRESHQQATIESARQFMADVAAKRCLGRSQEKKGCQSKVLSYFDLCLPDLCFFRSRAETIPKNQ